MLTAAPFRGLPQPEAHGRRNLTATVQEERLRCALSCCPPPTVVGITVMPDAYPCPAHDHT
ncbi:hypothetical protein AL978_16825 [Salmonella enterica subsp. enterica]|nr:hypothetical protein [Salmonella enterica subsp. enterica]